MQVIKRDGCIVPFDQNKIINAILAAFKQVDGETSEYAFEKAKKIADYITQQAKIKTNYFNIEEIQDLVEKGLMATKRKDVAKAYILYRKDREKERLKRTDLFKTIKEKLEATNVQNQNANIDEYSFGGRQGEATDAMMKQYALDYLISDIAQNNYLNNEIYIHDLNHYALGDHNCLVIPFDKLLANGFNTRQMDIRPANSIGTAFQLLACIFQLQSLQEFG